MNRRAGSLPHIFRQALSQEANHENGKLGAITAVTWIVHATAWTHCDGTPAGLAVSSAAALVMTLVSMAWLLAGQLAALGVPAGAVIPFWLRPPRI